MFCVLPPLQVQGKMFYVFFIPECRGGELLCKCRWKLSGKSSTEILETRRSLLSVGKLFSLSKRRFVVDASQHYLTKIWKMWSGGNLLWARKSIKHGRAVYEILLRLTVKAFSCFIYKFMQRTKRREKRRRKVASIAHKTWRKPSREPINQVREQQSLRIINFSPSEAFLPTLVANRRKALL